MFTYIILNIPRLSSKYDTHVKMVVLKSASPCSDWPRLLISKLNSMPIQIKLDRKTIFIFSVSVVMPFVSLGIWGHQPQSIYTLRTIFFVQMTSHLLCWWGTSAVYPPGINVKKKSEVQKSRHDEVNYSRNQFIPFSVIWGSVPIMLAKFGSICVWSD